MVGAAPRLDPMTRPAALSDCRLVTMANSKQKGDEALDTMDSEAAGVLDQDDSRLRWVDVDGHRVQVHGVRASELAEDPKNYEPPRMVVPGLAASGRVTMLAAREKVGKSTYAAYAATIVSRGGELWGSHVEPGVVLWIGLEEDRADALRRFMEMGADLDNIVIVEHLLGDGGAKQLKAEVVAAQPMLVVVDSLAAYAEHIEDENGAAGWTRELKQVVKIARTTRAAIVMLHHASKGTGAYRGSTAIGASMDMIVEMSSSTEDRSVRSMSARGRWELEAYEIRYEREDRAFSLVRSGGLLREDVDPVEELKPRVLEWLTDHPGARPAEVRKGVGGRANLVDQALKALLGDSKVEYLGRGSGYRVAASDGDAVARSVGVAA